MEKYHSRRPERVIDDTDELVRIIRREQYLTLAMCKEDEPYIATVNYAFDQRCNCFYFHCAPKGKKVAYLTANPTVWGQILHDEGYLQGDCDHAYRTVQFKGRVEFLDDPAEKRYALHLMIDQLEENPDPVKQKFLAESSFATAAVGRIQIEGMSGKQSARK